MLFDKVQALLPSNIFDTSIHKPLTFAHTIFLIPAYVFGRILILKCIRAVVTRSRALQPPKRDGEVYESFRHREESLVESIFFFLLYSSHFAFGAWLIHAQGDKWEWSTDFLIRERPWEDVLVKSNLVHLYYNIQLSHYIASSIHLAFEERKGYKDFIIMIFHHFLTIGLVLSSGLCLMLRAGLAIATLHDFSDILLEFSKIINYLGYQRLSCITFSLFAASFYGARNIVYTKFAVIDILRFDPEFFWKTWFRSFLTLLGAINAMWAVFITRMVFRLVKDWKSLVDIRTGEWEPKAVLDEEEVVQVKEKTD